MTSMQRNAGGLFFSDTPECFTSDSDGRGQMVADEILGRCTLGRSCYYGFLLFEIKLQLIWSKIGFKYRQ